METEIQGDSQTKRLKGLLDLIIRWWFLLTVQSERPGPARVPPLHLGDAFIQFLGIFSRTRAALIVGLLAGGSFTDEQNPSICLFNSSTLPREGSPSVSMCWILMQRFHCGVSVVSTCWKGSIHVREPSLLTSGCSSLKIKFFDFSFFSH